MEHIIDGLDKKILSILTKNARTSFLDVARECSISGAAVHQRVHKLIDLGIITGSEFLVDSKKIGYSTLAYIGIFLEKAKYYKDVVKSLEMIPEIVECHYTTGDYAMFIKVYAIDNEHLKAILTDKLQTIEGITSTQTFISLEQDFKRQAPIL